MKEGQQDNSKPYYVNGSYIDSDGIHEQVTVGLEPDMVDQFGPYPADEGARGELHTFTYRDTLKWAILRVSNLVLGKN